MKSLNKLVIAFLAFFMLALASGSAFAAAPAATEPRGFFAYDVFLKLNGIDGESNVIGYEKWIVLSTASFSIANQSKEAGAGGSGGKAVLNEFTVTKRFDASSIALFQASAAGSMIKSGQLVFVPQGEGRKTPVLTFDLKDIGIASYSFNNLEESISLTFTSMTLEYAAMNGKGGSNPPITGGWDFGKNQKQ